VVAVPPTTEGESYLKREKGGVLVGIKESDWQVLTRHVKATPDEFKVPAAEKAEALAFVESTKRDSVD
jgi:hypothetical protein